MQLWSFFCAARPGRGQISRKAGEAVRGTIPINQNHVFRRLYGSGKNSVSPYVAVYVKKNRLQLNRLGITTSKKIGGAVQRNRAKRVIKEAYRLMEPKLACGFDIVIVARKKAVYAKMQEVMASLGRLLEGQHIMRQENSR